MRWVVPEQALGVQLKAVFHQAVDQAGLVVVPLWAQRQHRAYEHVCQRRGCITTQCSDRLSCTCQARTLRLSRLTWWCRRAPWSRRLFSRRP